ncbi:hypothetical protein F937_01780 [Acinetobacter calcoaceticus ANC 3680]|uniref:hypothetical protein n=1 Tax=Acinetobacter calcoaceticus TaxID=471 RepID=UPI0002CD979B|nr:hypothetical protein [Acinetobacter calcoaceticus]ENV92386.1 hypothetical protein F937_01780 [Acinetobacter calcoaceticus ANC 3680]
MDKCREEFERSKTFKYFYSTLMHFDEELNCYSSNNSLRVRDAELLTAAWWSFQEQQAKVEGLQRRNQMLSDSILEMGSKHIRDTDLINQQASTLFRLREFIYGAGDLREYSDEELVEHQRILKVILAGEQALKGEG